MYNISDHVTDTDTAIKKKISEKLHAVCINACVKDALLSYNLLVSVEAD